METLALIDDWFDKWERGDFLSLPLDKDFKHTSPFGTIDGKEAYLNLVKQNRDKFLGHRFTFHDKIIDGARGCVRYTTQQEDFAMDVSEWIYVEEGLIKEIISYYHVGEIREDRRLKDDDNVTGQDG